MKHKTINLGYADILMTLFTSGKRPSDKLKTNSVERFYLDTR